MLEFGIYSRRRIFYAGECVKFYLSDTAPLAEGSAFLRTNLGMAAIHRREIINEVEKNQRPAGRDWQDIAMHRVAADRFEVEMILTDTGVFELKPFFVPADGRGELLWPAGENLQIKIESAENIGANLMYTAFVRQFGGNCCRTNSIEEADAAELAALDQAGYTVIPPSGTFRDLIGKLDFIFGKLGSRILQLLPIHPVPTVYGRMGRYGSPFASLDYFAVDPSLAVFDESATPLEQFGELVDAVHERKGRIFLDIPVNHTGWASRLQVEHPDWFVRDAASRRIESPGAWGIVWADLCKLDYSRKEVQCYMAEVFLYWCRKGVDGFRCDAGYMLPESAWRYIEAKVRNEYPDTVFMLEGLGGPLDKQEKLLGNCGLDWGYSELFQNYSREEVERYSAYSASVSAKFGTLINFAETHDNNRLASVSETFAMMRCALMCFMSDGGAFGFTNGVEWFAAEKVDVHEARSLNWGASRNMVDFLQRLHGAMRQHRAFYGGAEKRWENRENSQALAIRRQNGDSALLGLINLDWRNRARVRFGCELYPEGFAVNYDLLSAKEYKLISSGREFIAELAPGECRLLTSNAADLEQQNYELQSPFRTPEIIRQQKLALTLGKTLQAAGIAVNNNIKSLMDDFLQDWRSLFRSCKVTVFCNHADNQRLLMVPPGWCLAIHSSNAFRAELKLGERTLRFERSVRLAPESYFALFAPLNPEEAPVGDFALALTNFINGKVERSTSYVRYLPSENEDELVHLHFDNNALKSGPPRHALGVNDLGGYAQIPARWGELTSKYDALLAANLNQEYPVDRRVMLVRCKVWLVLNGFSQEVNFAVQEHFRMALRNQARWEFDVPMGQGKVVKLDITGSFAFNANSVKLEFRRRPGNGNLRMLPDHTAVQLIVRPQIDDRDNHAVTKAYSGAENGFRNAVAAQRNGFVFAPAADRKLQVKMSDCSFFREDEWSYMNELPLENYYGLDHCTDLYSPGYFSGTLESGATAILEACAGKNTAEVRYPATERFPASVRIMDAAACALESFVVRRNEFQTVIAGYPWFLDWGRDTLIALRGLIAAGNLEAARDIILQFAGFEKHGTIPNMIRGSNDSNRDTSDAPLWLAVAVNDYMKAVGSRDILECRAGAAQRPVLDIIESIAHHYRVGTGNGIFADAESNLIYSPPHFTWMDTNYPAATPRAGYPVEIQALWFALQSLLGQLDKKYATDAEMTRKSIMKYYYHASGRFFSDCLHGSADTPAAQAQADNALRPNMLFAVTLGAVTEPAAQQIIVENAGRLIIPGAIRSLGNQQVIPPLPVKLHGHLLNDPDFPYRGHYCGPEDTSRKIAYHNGTAWCWPFPSYVEALYMYLGDSILPTARALLKSSSAYFNDGCPGQLPEVSDGDYPHHWGGCAAQAWSVSEFYRVGKLLGM
ncbi:MAG: glycogen debranching protein [Lentisphaerae bacterium]|nr:glycogen debranching protein [Lentisphaerota bacterium]